MAAETPAAPLDRAVEEARKAKRYDFRDVSLSYQTDWQPVEEECGDWVRAEVLIDLLAALDADRRLEEAEAALREIEKTEGLWADDAAQFQRNRIDNMQTIAHRYFARREGKKGENRESER